MSGYERTEADELRRELHEVREALRDSTARLRALQMKHIEEQIERNERVLYGDMYQEGRDG